jgi:hypothetical protein
MGFSPGMDRIFGRNFWGAVQRRGTHVNTPKIGSRVGEFCFGEIWGFYAELRRELFRRNFKLDFFWFLSVGPRERGRRGDRCVRFGGIYLLIGLGTLL